MVVVCALGVIAGVVGVSYPFVQYIRAIREAERRFVADTELAAPVLASDPAFKWIGPTDFPVLGFCLSGPVPTRADYDRLRSEMLRLFGEARVDHVMNDVRVESPQFFPNRRAP